MNDLEGKLCQRGWLADILAQGHNLFRLRLP